jgi:hypothetical protein
LEEGQALSQILKRIFLAGAVALTVVLLWASISPRASEVAAVGPHWLPHLASFGALAFAWAMGVPRAPTLIVALAVIAFGFAHEAIEIVGHAHGYELRDAIVDGIGGVAGALLARVVRAWFALD